MPYILGIFFGALLQFLTRIILPLVLKLLAYLGIGFITFQGLDIALESVVSMTQSSFFGIPEDIKDIAGLMKIDVALSMIIAAYEFVFLTKIVNGVTRKFSTNRTYKKV